MSFSFWAHRTVFIFRSKQITNCICHFDRIWIAFITFSEVLLLNKADKKECESGFPYCFLTDFTKFFLVESTLLDFGYLAEEVSWIHRIFKIWCHYKNISKFKFV